MLKAGIPRDQLFFTSKVPPRDINYKGAKKCVDESLKKTGYDFFTRATYYISNSSLPDSTTSISIYFMHHMVVRKAESELGKL